MRGEKLGVAVVTAVMASAFVQAPALAAGSQPSNADLAKLVKQQAEQIKRLNASVDSLESSRSNRQSSSTSSSNSPGKSGSVVPDTGIQPAPSSASMASMRHDIDELKKNSLKVDWGDGAPEFSTADGEFSFGIGGRIQYDFSSTSGSRFDSDGSQSNLNSRNITGTEFRRLRLDAHGQLTKPFFYKLEIDFAGNGTELKSVYLGGKKNFELGEGVIYLGSSFADTGLDGRTSSKWTWFADRNAVANLIDFAPGAYNIGVSSVFYGNNDSHISLALTKGSTSDSNNSSNNFLVRSRAHWDPVDTGTTILHVGANGYYEDFNRQRTPTFGRSDKIASHYNGNLKINGPTINAESIDSYGFELAGLSGRFAAGAEYARLNMNARDGDDTHLDAYSGQIGYSLTGEQFGYSTKKGVWTHPNIANPVNKGGIGAWEMVARYEAVDTNGNGYAGGTGHGTTVGLNWYLNDYLRVLVDDTLWQTHNRVPLTGNISPSSGYYGHDDGNTVFGRIQLVF